MGIKKNFFEKFDKDWDRLPRAVTESPSIEGFKRRVDMVLKDMV